MNVVVALEHRFDRTPDGKVWTQVAFPHSFWMRYLEVFDHVRVVARVREVPSVSGDWKRADGEGVSFAAIPYYLGPWQYLQKAPQVQRAARNAVAPNDAVILRVSSQIATCIQPMLSQTNHPYAVEVVADPYDVFAPGAVKHPLRPFFRWWFPRGLRHQCAGALSAAYVTEGALQCRYPPGPGAFSTHYSSVELPNSAFAAAPRCDDRRKQTFTLVSVGTLAQLYKAPDVLIDAVATCVQSGLNLKLVLIGDGKYRSELEARSQACGIADRVCFLGQLSAGDAVRAELDRADIFILPSRQEGLPRAMIEAMARSLPCIGSTVGGIPELLPPEDMVPPGDATALANKIREVVTNPERMSRMSACNLEKAKDYRDEVLQERRNQFYRYVREMTEKWLRETR
ncbi:glycosyltransferase family 4 protein [Microcoleus sp. D3_18a_C4]|uniref:glycosyltransferase family 4 protein n=1 Tax=unclassified Microcoleus TaxID=2642155 RepID=UPI002FD2BFA2